MKVLLTCSLLAIQVALGQAEGAGQLTGTVEDLSSAPVEGTVITLLSLHRVLQTRSAANGSFEFDNVEPGAYILEATRPGFTKKTVPVTIQEGNLRQTHTVTLNVGNQPDMGLCGRDVSVRYGGRDAAGSNLAGTLRDYFSHKPVRNAEVRIVSETNRQLSMKIRSDKNGRFAVGRLAPDYYDVQIAGENYEPEELKHVIVPEENKVMIESTLRKRNQLVMCQ